MFYVIGNIYKGKGFTWVEEEDAINFNDLWKYSRHGEFESEEDANIKSEELNNIYG